jgi:ABC-type lipoprotein release transport system permease subunit
MKEKSRLRLLFALLFTTIIICLGLVAIIIAMSLSLTQWKQENKNIKDKNWSLEVQLNNLKPTYTDKQQAILQSVVGNPDISKLVKTKSVLGGKWGVWSEKGTKFLTEDKLLVLFDDGHLMGAMVIKVKDPSNIKSWKVLWSTML